MKKREKLKNVQLLILSTLIALIICFPIFYILYISIEPPSKVFSYPPQFSLSELTFNNFVEVFNLTPFLRFIVNSLIVAIISCLLQVIFACTAAFAFTFYNYKVKDILFLIVLATIMIPAQTIFIGNYLIIRSLGFLNTYIALILPNAVSAFGIFFIRQYFKTIPVEFFEAAKIEGCSNINYLVKILIPLSKPAIGSFLIYSFINIWNQYMWPLLVTDKDEVRTVQLGISMLQAAEQQNFGLIAAGVIIVILPTFLIFLLGHNQLVKGLMAGALKG
ncbi:carbohydrate ABC transporter permease [Caldicellulosiruptor changbaiensis]|uniref:Carbohydrate ABC transporter permease n=1 Tax=Caldicellulosiruptor changbaiensis TaxID=1222016 RepID=A0A3T0D8R8_9FIRM|nr:carbohydrate ABC transporter permease [Caldicellulosiruptor changbaiensis]AZT91376.1 carbohydrate ABC transporter permease [Caldicellulosiruptor changbaiensis]